MPNRVVITGLGIISSIGIGREEFWKNTLAGKSGGRRIEYPWMNRDAFYTHIGAPVSNFTPTDFNIMEKELPFLDLVSVFALAAAYMSIRDAGFAPQLIDGKKGFHAIDGIDQERLAVVIGSGIGGLTTTEISHGQWNSNASRVGMKRYSLPMLIPNAPGAQVAMKYQAKAECKTISTACAAGTMAIGDAYRLIREGKADYALAGGAEAILSDQDGYGLLGFDLLSTLSTRNDDPEHASRPFDKNRDGFVLSEGAAILMLEKMENARARGAGVYAEIAGYESSCDAYSMMMLEPNALQIIRLMKNIIGKSGVSADEVDYINAHGTATVLNDKTETFAIKEAFGRRAYDLIVTSTKSMTGHAIAASGAIEAVSTALTIRNGKIPATINYETPDPECDLNYLPDGPVDRKVRAALSNSYGFGGHNASLLMKRFE